MPTAFVLWGVGSLGAAQVGMLRSLTAAGVRPDFVVGTSVGALNGFYYAAQPDLEGVERLARMWETISRHDVFPLNPSAMVRALAEQLPWSPARGVLRALGVTNYTFPFDPTTMLAAALGQANHLVDNSRLEHFLGSVLPVEQLDQTEIPIEVLTADAIDGRTVSFWQGPALPPLMASTAIPVVYPSVEIDGRVLVDGAVADETGLDWAVRHGADEVYLLTPGLAGDMPRLPSNVLTMAVHTHNLLAHHNLSGAMARALTNPLVRLHQLPPVSPLDFLPLDFEHTTDLIDRAAENTSEWLARSSSFPSAET